MKSSRGISLLEVMIICVIVALLAGLLFPVLGRAKKRGLSAVCLNQSRQVALATLMYREEYDSFPRSPGLEPVTQSGLLNDKRLLICPDDNYGGLFSEDLKCRKIHSASPLSYYNPFDPALAIWNEIHRVDPNAGILACRLHGRATHHKNQARGDFCRHVPFLFEGPILRIRLDGSAKLVPFGLDPDKRQPGAFESFRLYRLFTDEKTMWDGER